MNNDHNKKFGLLKFHSGYGKFYLNSPKGYSWKIINAQTGAHEVKWFHSNFVCSYTEGGREDKAPVEGFRQERREGSMLHPRQGDPPVTEGRQQAVCLQGAS